MSKRHIKDNVNQVPLTAYLAPVQKVEVTPNKTLEITCDNIWTEETDRIKTQVDNSIVTVMTDSAQDETIKNRKHNSPEEVHPPKSPICKTPHRTAWQS